MTSRTLRRRTASLAALLAAPIACASAAPTPTSSPTATATAVERHRMHLEASGGRAAREATRARRLDELAGRIARHEADPYALAEDVAGRLR